MTARFLAIAAVLFCVIVLPVSMGVAAGSGAGIGPALGLYLAIAAIAALRFDRTYPHARVGVCNAMTLARAALIAPTILVVTRPELLSDTAGRAWLLLALAVVSLSLDGIDGFFARRQGLVSGFGARFDVEVDSVFALILALVAMQGGKAGVWVLALGLPRYLFVGAGLVMPWLARPLPERFSRKLVCVLQIAVLIALLAPIVVPPVSWVIAGVASVLVLWSFAVDVAWLARQRR